MQKEIKYIVPMHSFSAGSSMTSSQYSEQNKPKYTQVLVVFRNIQDTMKNPNLKNTLKESDFDLLNMTNSNIQNFRKQHANNKEIVFIIDNLLNNKRIFSAILKKTQHKRIEDLTKEEFEQYCPIDIENDFTNASHLRQWFTLYINNHGKKSSKAIDEYNEAIMKKLHLEKKPWELMNEILKKYGFKYQIVDFNPDIAPIKIEFTDGTTTVEIEGLSSGEQQIISLVAWAHHEIISENIKLLLLDEPDAHLHPSFCRIFIEIMKEYVVEKHGIKVIMTTHSPSTIAHAPKESIFVMNEKEPRIEKQDKDIALDILSDGLMILSDDSRVVIGKIKNSSSQNIFICEGETDKAHIENCIKLFPDELESLFSEWEIMPAGCASNITHCRKSHKIFNKELKGFTDNDDEGQKASNSKNILSLPKINNQDTDIEKFLGVTQKFYEDNDKIQSLKEEIIQAVRDDYERKKIGLEQALKNIKKILWKEYLTNLIKNNQDEAKKYYKDFKDFLIKIHSK